MKAILYARYSPRPDGRSESATAQLERCRAYCGLRDLQVVAEFSDQEVSGGQPFAQRPAGRQVLGLLTQRSPGAEAVVIAKLDRGWRSTIDCLQTVQTWSQRGIALHIVDFQGSAIDTASPMGKMFLTILAAMAEWEREMIRERTRVAMLHHQANGRLMGSRAPYGWRISPNDKRLIIVDPVEQSHIARMRELHELGYGLREIGRQLEAEGILCRQGKWYHTTVKAIIKRAEIRAGAEV